MARELQSQLPLLYATYYVLDAHTHMAAAHAHASHTLKMSVRRGKIVAYFRGRRRCTHADTHAHTQAAHVDN